MLLCNNPHPHIHPWFHAVPSTFPKIPTLSLMLVHSEPEQKSPDIFYKKTVKCIFTRKRNMMDVLQGVYLLLTPHVACLVVLLLLHANDLFKQSQ